MTIQNSHFILQEYLKRSLQRGTQTYAGTIQTTDLGALTNCQSWPARLVRLYMERAAWKARSVEPDT